MTALLIAIIVLWAGATLYFAVISKEFRKFLAGAFFVCSGVLFYLYITKVSVPILFFNLTETPEISGMRAIVHFVLFLTTLYFGFIRK